jgi:hypothetical protein
MSSTKTGVSEKAVIMICLLCDVNICLCVLFTLVEKDVESCKWK